MYLIVTIQLLTTRANKPC